MNSEYIYSNLGYTTEQIKEAIAKYLNLELIISKTAFNFKKLTKYEDIWYAVQENTIYVLETNGYTYMIFSVNDGENISQFALLSDGSIRYRKGKMGWESSDDGTHTDVFIPDDGYRDFKTIFENYFTKDEINGFLSKVEERLRKLETPAHIVSGTQKSLVGITTLQTEAGNVSDNNIAFGLSGAALIDIQGYVDIAFECRGEIAVYIDDEKVYYFDFNTLSYIGSPEFVGNINKGIRVTNIGSSAITFTRFSVPSYKGGILTDEQAEKVIRTEVLTTPEKNKLAQTQLYTAGEKHHVDRLSKIKDAGYTWVQKNLIELQNEGKLIAGEDTVVSEDKLRGGSEVTINVDANVELSCSPQAVTKCYIDGVLYGRIYNGYVHTITFKNVGFGEELSVTNISLKIAQYNGGFITDEQIQDTEQVKHDTEWNAKNIDTLNTKTEAIKDAKVTKNVIRLSNLYSNGQITNDTSELTCAARIIKAPLGGDTIIQYTGKARLALDPVENLALYIDDVLIEDNEFYGTINNNITLKDNGTGGYTANFSYIQSLTYTGGMFTDAEFEVYEDLKHDFGEVEVLLDEVRQKTDSHVTNKSNPHGVTASQINAFTKAQTRTEIQTVVDAARVEIDSKKADKDDVSNAFKGQASGELIQLTDISPIVHGIKVKCSPGAKVIGTGKNLIGFPYFRPLAGSTGVSSEMLQDGGLKVVGTNEGTAIFAHFLETADVSYEGHLPIKKGTYFLSGTKNGAEVRLSYYRNANSERTSVVAPATITFNDNNGRYSIFIAVRQGVTVDEVVYPMLELGTEATEYEKNPRSVVVSDADGNAIIPSVYPTTTLFTDVDGAMIEAEYNKDLNKVFGDTDKALETIIAEQEAIIAMQNSLIGGDE